MTTRVLVTGAAGFIAGHLATALREAGDVVLTGVDIRPVAAARVHTAWHANLAEAGEAERVVAAAHPDEVYHLVGDSKGQDADVMSSNVDTARTLLDAVGTAAPAATVVLMGSAAEYGNVPPHAQPVREDWDGVPVSAYGRAKREVSALAATAAHAGLRVVVARPFNVVGAYVPEVLVVGAVVQRLRSAISGPLPRRITVGNLRPVRDFVDVDDIARGLVVLARRGERGAAYNLCTGAGHSVQDVVERLVRLAGGDVTLESVPGLSSAGEVGALVGSPARAAALGWRARRSLDDSLAAAWAASALEEPA